MLLEVIIENGSRRNQITSESGVVKVEERSTSQKWKVRLLAIDQRGIKSATPIKVGKFGPKYLQPANVGMISNVPFMLCP